MTSPQPLAALLKQHRGELGLTQSQAAETIGVHAEEYGRWERGSVISPRATSRARIARFLGIEFVDLNLLIENADRRDFSDAEQRIIEEVRRLLDQRRNGDET